MEKRRLLAALLVLTVCLAACETQDTVSLADAEPPTQQSGPPTESAGEALTHETEPESEPPESASAQTLEELPAPSSDSPASPAEESVDGSASFAEPETLLQESSVDEESPGSSPEEPVEGSSESDAASSSPPEQDPSSASAEGGAGQAASVRALEESVSPAIKMEQELLRLINEERQRSSLTELGVEESMEFAARIRAQEALESLSHTRPDDTPYYTVFDEAGFVYAGKWHGENVSVIHVEGELDPVVAAESLFDEWLSSPGHHQNILGENFLQTGIGVYLEETGEVTRIGSAQLFSSL